jgi:hypothetical protein
MTKKEKLESFADLPEELKTPELCLTAIQHILPFMPKKLRIQIRNILRES